MRTQCDNEKKLKKELRFFRAVEAGDIESLKEMLRSFTQMPNAAVSRAADCDQPDILTLFLKVARGRGNQHELDYSLLSAAKDSRIEIAKILIQHGANINARIFLNRTPLLEASERGHVEMVRLLCDYGRISI